MSNFVGGMAGEATTKTQQTPAAHAHATTARRPGGSSLTKGTANDRTPPLGGRVEALTSARTPSLASVCKYQPALHYFRLRFPQAIRPRGQ